MPINIKLYNIFLASPGDLALERINAEGIIVELNQTLIDKGVQLNLIKWENSAYPSMGSDPQNVINRQIGDTYDIFIGLMWAKFGTPTPRAGSGTEEEFNRVYDRYKTTPEEVKIMFYFNTKPIPINKIDPEQITKINNFKSQLGDKGGLYWEYSDINEFERYLRLHLVKVINELEKRPNSFFTPVKQEEVESKLDIDELGIFDYLNSAEEFFEELTIVMHNMTDIVETLGSQISKRASDLNNGFKNSKEAMKIIDRAAKDMENFVLRMESELPIFKETLANALDSYISAIQLYKNWQGEESEEVNSILDALAILAGTFEDNNEKILNLKTQITILPSVTKSFNKEKKDSIQILNKIFKELSLAKNQIDQFILTMRGDSSIQSPLIDS